MTYSEAQIDIEKEKKKNIKLAIGVAAFGIFGFILVYIFMFVLMLLKPGLIFSFVPFPHSFSKDFVGVGDKLYVISYKLDLEEISFVNEMLPQKKVMIGTLEENKISFLKETGPFSSLSHDSEKIYFFSEGKYRTFDGENLKETETNVIGQRPQGIISPEGLWVLSIIKGRPILNLIKGAEAFSFPLPEKLVPYHDHNYPCSVRLLWYKDILYLYWTSAGNLYWATFDGKEWSVLEFSGNYESTRAVSDTEHIYLFNKRFSQQHHHTISYTVFESGAWSKPVEVTIPGLFIEWSPLIYHDRTFIVVRSFFSEKLYEIRNGMAVNPVIIGGTFSGAEFISGILQLILAVTLFCFLCVSIVSFFIGKFKLRTWKTDSSGFEFASLFRRFIAKFIDSFVIMLPPLLLLLYFLIHIEDVSDMFRLLILLFISAGYFIVVPFLYNSLLEGLYGTTIGKRICGIRVLKDDFTECGLLAGFLRNLLRIVDYLFYYLVAVVTVAATLKWQRLGDVVAGTVVVRKRTERFIK